MKWFGDVERLSTERLTKRVYGSEEVGVRDREVLARVDWTESKNSHEIRDAKVNCEIRKQGRNFPNDTNDDMNV